MRIRNEQSVFFHLDPYIQQYLHSYYATHASSYNSIVYYSSAKPGVMPGQYILFSNLDERLYSGDMVPLAL